MQPITLVMVHAFSFRKKTYMRLVLIWVSVYECGLTLFPALICYHTPNYAWNEVTNALQTEKLFHSTLYDGYNYLSICE